ncbi:MAG TPA: indolepyruvate oxidoreductase subunit beta family protein, partial [Rhizobiales bacterium]|nr:indolepyruvate oxidoreductase subunit beta family protein [Hyphomicrobiales bacterium]
MNSQGPVCILIAALGGQGGGVLADWLVTAARLAGLESQATSIPGVAQRTGATTYYFEVWREPDLPSRPVFSIFPASGAIDLVVSFEPMEAARALSGGYIGAETTVISARERIFSTFEKIRPGDGVTPLAPVFDALEKMASSLRIIDMTDAARSAKCHPNAVMFGAMAASGILPMPPDVCREAIRKGGVAVDANLSGFEAGMKLLNSPARTNGRPEARLRPCPDAFSPAIAALPEAVQAMAGHGAARLLDYQDRAYVQLYLDRLTRIVLLDKRENGWRLSQKVARALAAWMAFEDVIEVARLKTRPGRFARIRAELGIGDDEPLIVHDYLKPGREELRGLLPGFLSKWIPESQDSNSHGGFSLRLNSAGPAGFA